MPASETIRVPHRELDDFTYSVFHALGIPPGDARIVVDVLSQANLRGVETHGTDMLPSYVRRIRGGMINPKPRIRAVKEAVATMVIDADQALGHVGSKFGMQQAINKALMSGVGWVNVINSNHHAALAYYALMAAEQDMIGIVSTTTASCMAPWGSRQPLVGNNPLAVAVPCNRHDPLVLDMSCSLFAHGRVRLARERGEPIPDGLSIDADGNPNSDPEKSASLLPFGSYKGSGLAMMLGFLSGALAGSTLTGYQRGQPASGPSELSHLMIAVNIDSFDDLEEFKETVDETIESWKGSATRPGFDEVYVPGEIEWRHVPDREENGIPLNASLVAELRKIAEELELKFPAAV